MLALAVVLLALLAPTAEAQVVTTDRHAVFGLAGGELWAEGHGLPRYPPSCPRRGPADAGVDVVLVPYLEPPSGPTPWGGYADLASCRILIGRASWDALIADDRRCGSCWLRGEGLGLLIHEYAHFILGDPGHSRTPNRLDHRPEADALIAGWRALVDPRRRHWPTRGELVSLG
jgi:hypothetical protein